MAEKEHIQVSFHIELDIEDDGRVIADIPEYPGAIAYGQTEYEAIKSACEIACDIIADSY